MQLMAVFGLTPVGARIHRLWKAQEDPKTAKDYEYIHSMFFDHMAFKTCKPF